MGMLRPGMGQQPCISILCSCSTLTLWDKYLIMADHSNHTLSLWVTAKLVHTVVTTMSGVIDVICS